MKLFILIAALLAGSSLHAQSAADAARETRLPYAAAAVGGTAGVGAGWVVGGAAGLALADCDHVHREHFCGLEQFLVGGVIGGTVGAATGAYLGSRLAGAQPRPAVALAGAVLGLGAGFLTGLGLAELGLGPVPVAMGAAVGQGVFTGLLTASSLSW